MLDFLIVLCRQWYLYIIFREKKKQNKIILKNLFFTIKLFFSLELENKGEDENLAELHF